MVDGVDMHGRDTWRGAFGILRAYLKARIIISIIHRALSAWGFYTIYNMRERLARRRGFGTINNGGFFSFSFSSSFWLEIWVVASHRVSSLWSLDRYGYGPELLRCAPESVLPPGSRRPH